VPSHWSFAEHYVAAHLRALGCTDPKPLLGLRTYASGRIAVRCRLCGTTLPALVDPLVSDLLYEDDETRRPVAWLTTVGALRDCSEGTILRTGAGHLEALAYRVATTDDWSVTGFESLWDSQHMLNVCERWQLVTILDLDARRG
jgi:hypothetical protein